ncbi:MAG TPA: hypothetical protein VJ827_04550 [Rubrobacter sp.]|nr:hypothetical protein [Rubrobacter sp.]
MQDQINGSAGLATLEGVQPFSWQAAAVGEYEISLPTRHAELRKDLSARILALTGRQISPREIYTDGCLAVAGVDGVTFRLHHHVLVLMRSCSYCGTGQFEGPEISSISDLGYALSDWRPLHEDCEDFSAEDLTDF